MKADLLSSRPASVTFLVAGIFILWAFNVTRLVQSIQQWNFLAGLLPISPLYLVGTGLVWAAVLMPLAGGLWWGTWWAPRLAQVTAVAYAAYAWLDRLLLARPYGQGDNLPFAAVATLLCLGYVFWATLRPAARAFFRPRPS